MRILLVEDTRSMAAVFRARLEAFGYEVFHAENGQVAVERFSELAPDLVLMDIEMPVMNGFEAVSRIRAYEASRQWAWTPVIFLTASDSVGNLVQAIEAGGDDYLTKSAPEVVLQAKMKALSRIAALRRQLIAANRRLEEQATRDALTGLANRHHLDRHCDEAWMQACLHERGFGLLLLDIDHFKQYNDHYGHLEGDECLRSVAGALAGVAEQCGVAQALAARYGGEEFVLVLPGVGLEEVRAVAECTLHSIRGLRIPHQRNAGHGIVTASIGGAWVHRARDEIAPLFRLADANLYSAKASGRNRAVVSGL
ncbi:MAG: diguanylate cyclase domain-containing protein [Thiobacillaceae bacterium]